jgi:hypothetical protein
MKGSDVVVRLLIGNGRDRPTALAATEGRGSYRSLDAGVTWQPMGTVR